jgi:hypothetical protein
VEDEEEERKKERKKGEPRGMKKEYDFSLLLFYTDTHIPAGWMLLL